MDAEPESLLKIITRTIGRNFDKSQKRGHLIEVVYYIFCGITLAISPRENICDIEKEAQNGKKVTYLNWKVNWKPTKHAFRMSVRMDT